MGQQPGLMKNPAVTVVLPAYRRPDYLKESLASALNQTFADFEIILSDDGGSTEIAQVASSFGDPRVRYRANSRNLGIAMNHYAAFQEARGRYLACLHDDDLWEPTFLAELVPPLEADASVTVAFCDHQIIDAEGRLLQERTEQNSQTYRRSTLAAGHHQPFLEMAVIHESLPMAMGAVFRKSILKNADYPSRIGGSYDHWLAYLTARNGQAAFYVPKRLSRYRIHSNSGSLQRGRRNLQDAIYVRTRFLKDPLLAAWHRSLSNNLGVYYGKLALVFLDGKDFRRAWIMEKRAAALINRPKNFLGLLKNSALHFFASIWK